MKSTWRSPGWGGVLIVLLTFAAYLPVLHAGFVWDDDDYVTNNRLLRSTNGLVEIWAKPTANSQYYPMVFTSFWAEYHLWKLRPFGYHLVNVLLHAANAVLFWHVLRRLGVRGSWWAAAIFAVHPVMVESVAWIAERKNVLSGLFYLLAVLAFLRFRPLPDGKIPSTWDWRFYPLVVGLFLCALLSKTVTCSLPVVLLLLVWWKTGGVGKRDVLALAPLFVLGAGLGFTTVRIENLHLDSNQAEWTLSIAQRCLVAGRVLWFYAGKLFWPSRLTFFYPRWEIDAGAVGQYLFPLAAVGVWLLLWARRSQIGTAPLVAVSFFVLTLGPALGFVAVYPFRYSYVADHFQYLASIGLITLTAGAGAAVSAEAGQRGRDVGALAGAVVLLMLGVCTWRQAHVYQDLQTLWLDTLAKNPKAWMAHNNLAVLLEREGKVDEAVRHYQQALQIKPNYVEAHYNLGNTLLQAGRIEDAIRHYKEALRIYPDYPEIYSNLGNALLRAGKAADAVTCLAQALRIRPDYAEAHFNLGLALAQDGRESEAVSQWQEALRLKPDYAEAHYNLGVALSLEGKIEEAIGHWQQALRIKPDYADAHFNLGGTFARLGRMPEAIEHYEQAARLEPNSAETHYSLGVALEQVGKTTEAIQQYQQAVRIKPDYAEAQNRLARLRVVQ